jgi:FtsH-binding integral membrane protein
MTPAIINTVAVVLTLMVLSRIAGDNPLFRVAQYIFVGASLGLAFVVAYHQVLRPAVLQVAGGSAAAALLYAVPLALSLLLLPRISGEQTLSWLANIPLALIFGVGAALAVGGAIAGTIIPQILDTARPISGTPSEAVGAGVLVLGTIITLSTFYYTTPREGSTARLISAVAVVGHWLLMVAFGFFFAGAVQTYLSALTGQLSFVIGWLRDILGL